MQSTEALFPTDYRNGRERFLELTRGAGHAITSYTHPTQRGPAGEHLACDVARFGPRDARNLLLVSSGTHGVEGFCGSGAQAALLSSGLLRDLPKDAAVLLVHAVNPYGFAHLRRTNEDNIDLNRNFIDHSRAPQNPAYDEIHQWLVPAEWEGPERLAADRELQRYQETRGMRAFQAALTGGQYSHPDGLFFGGHAPAWSSQTWRQLLREHCDRAGHVVAIDLHTGLGPSGVGEAICVTDQAEHLRAIEIFGDDVKWTGSGESVSTAVGGSLVHGAREELGRGRLTMIGLEYGTYPIADTLEALRAETWLVARSRENSPKGREIKQRLRDVFYVDELSWKQAVVDRFLELVGRAIRRFS